MEDPLKWMLSYLKEFWDLVGPGGRLHPAYFLEHKGHLVIEGLLILTILYLFVQRAYKPSYAAEAPLTEEEVDQLCRDWQPEPLVPKVAVEDEVLWPSPVVVDSVQGKHVVVAGKKLLNLASTNFLGLTTDARVMETCRVTIDKYGVGACGPRGFYGTFDVHLQLEEDLARFMGTEEAVIYAYDVNTISSIIPTFANRKDVVVADEYVSYPIQQGCTLSRAKVYYFKHNDMADLERVLNKVEVDERRKRKPLNRRLLVVEGIYCNYGDFAPLDRLVELKEKYRYRLVVEESCSFGLLGKSGRGAGEHFGLRPGQIDILVASMGTALGSVGGFCVGTHEIVEHQRLSSSSYCFSASLPPYLAAAAVQSLENMQEEGRAKRDRLQSCCVHLRQQLAAVDGLKVYGTDKDQVSPVIHLHLDTQGGSRKEAMQQLTSICTHVRDHSGVLLTVAQYSVLDRVLPPCSIKVLVNSELEDQDVDLIVSSLRQAVREVLKRS